MFKQCLSGVSATFKQFQPIPCGFGGLGVHMGSVLYVFWSPGGAYVEGNAEGKVEGNAWGNAEGNAKGNAKGNAEGNAGGIFSLTMVSTPARGVMQ